MSRFARQLLAGVGALGLIGAASGASAQIDTGARGLAAAALAKSANANGSIYQQGNARLAYLTHSYGAQCKGVDAGIAAPNHYKQPACTPVAAEMISNGQFTVEYETLVGGFGFTSAMIDDLGFGGAQSTNTTITNCALAIGGALSNQGNGLQSGALVPGMIVTGGATLANTTIATVVSGTSYTVTPCGQSVSSTTLNYSGVMASLAGQFDLVDIGAPGINDAADTPANGTTTMTLTKDMVKKSQAIPNVSVVMEVSNPPRGQGTSASTAINGAALTIGGAITGIISLDATVTCGACQAGTKLISGSGTSFQVSPSQTVASTTMTYSVPGLTSVRASVNDQQAAYGLLSNVPVINYSPDVVDAASTNGVGSINPLYSNDQLHLNFIGSKAAARRFLASEASSYGPAIKWNPWWDVYDPTNNVFGNLLPYAAGSNIQLFAGSGGSLNNGIVGTAPTGWSIYAYTGTGSQITASVVTPASGYGTSGGIGSNQLCFQANTALSSTTLIEALFSFAIPASIAGHSFIAQANVNTVTLSGTYSGNPTAAVYGRADSSTSPQSAASGVQGNFENAQLDTQGEIDLLRSAKGTMGRGLASATVNVAANTLTVTGGLVGTLAQGEQVQYAGTTGFVQLGNGSGSVWPLTGGTSPNVSGVAASFTTYFQYAMDMQFPAGFTGKACFYAPRVYLPNG